ncbi:MAG: hypothetical protein NZM43_12680 [Saprospiraceae bacterium]|nr:hypothetical protein [Saprospiraceae bacterium]MDW8485168.1 hypothetical protein [Saprospiraceae bacterium]
MCRFLFKVIFILLSTSATNSQNIKLSIRPQLGLRIHDDTFSGVQRVGGRYIMPSPTVGLSIFLDETPLSLNWQTDFNGVPRVRDTLGLAPSFLSETWISHQLQICYRLKNLDLYLGGYWQRQEGLGNHLQPETYEWKTWGAHLGVGLPISWLNVEYRTRIRIWPDFAAIISSSQHSLLFLYNFDKKRRPGALDDYLIVNGLIGSRFFYTGNIDLLYGEDLTPIGISPSLGIEIIHKNSNISLNLERDWWIAFNGGSPSRDMKGYINSSFIGLSYHKILKNNRYIRFRLGGSFIIDYDLLDELTVSNPDKDKIGSFYQVKGLGTLISYELLLHTDLEIKYTFPFNGYQFFNLTRLSIGLIYRYNPNR